MHSTVMAGLLTATAVGLGAVGDADVKVDAATGKVVRVDHDD